MSDVVTVEIWNPSYGRSKVDLSALPDLYNSLPESASIGLTLDDGGDNCVIVTVEEKFSTVSALRDRTFYNLQLRDDTDSTVIMVAGEEMTWPKGCLLPRDMGVQVLIESSDRDTMWARHSWVEQ